MDTLWKVNGFCVIQRPSSSQKKDKRDDRDRREEGTMKGKRSRDGETTR